MWGSRSFTLGLALAIMASSAFVAVSSRTSQDPTVSSLKRDKSGTEIRISDATIANLTSLDLAPSSAASTFGDVLIAWTSSASTLKAKLYKDNATTAVTSSFEVAPVSPASPAGVVAFDSGNFLVVWVDPAANTTIQGRLFGRDSLPLGSPFTIAQSTAEACYPSAQRMSGRNILVTWSTREGNVGNLYALSLTNFGTPASSPTKLTTFPAKMGPSTIGVCANDTAIVFFIMDQVGTPNLYGVPVASNASAIGKLFAVNPFTLDHAYPSASSMASGFTAVTWTGRVGSSNVFAVFAAIYSPKGVAITTPFKVNNSTDVNATRSTIAGVANGNLFLTWVEEATPGSPLLFGRLLDPVGASLKNAEALTPNPNGLQSNPSSVALLNAKVLVTWANQKVPPTLDEDSDVYGAIYSDTTDSTRFAPSIALGLFSCAFLFVQLLF